VRRLSEPPLAISPIPPVVVAVKNAVRPIIAIAVAVIRTGRSRDRREHTRSTARISVIRAAVVTTVA
jgi:hypothetical protein